MFGRRKEPRKLTGESPFRQFSFKKGSYGPPVALAELVDEGQIDFLNSIQEQTGESIDLLAPSAEGPGPVVDMSDPETQRVMAGLDEEIKRGIERDFGKTALANTIDENGDLKW